MPVASPRSALHGPATPQGTVPPEALIVQKADEIWLSQERESGCGLKHWFEAKLLLQRT
jgi:hypothetical protein